MKVALFDSSAASTLSVWWYDMEIEQPGIALPDILCILHPVKQLHLPERGDDENPRQISPHHCDIGRCPAGWLQATFTQAAQRTANYVHSWATYPWHKTSTHSNRRTYSLFTCYSALSTVCPPADALSTVHWTGYAWPVVERTSYTLSPTWDLRYTHTCRLPPTGTLLYRHAGRYPPPVITPPPVPTSTPTVYVAVIQTLSPTEWMSRRHSCGNEFSSYHFCPIADTRTFASSAACTQA